MRSHIRTQLQVRLLTTFRCSTTAYTVEDQAKPQMLPLADGFQLQHNRILNVRPQTCEEMSLMASAKCLWRRSTHMVSFSFSTCCFSSTCPAAVLGRRLRDTATRERHYELQATSYFSTLSGYCSCIVTRVPAIDRSDRASAHGPIIYRKCDAHVFSSFVVISVVEVQKGRKGSNQTSRRLDKILL